MTALAAEAFHFGNGHARDADVGQRRTHRRSLKGLMIAVTSFMSELPSGLALY